MFSLISGTLTTLELELDGAEDRLGLWHDVLTRVPFPSVTPLALENILDWEDWPYLR